MKMTKAELEERVKELEAEVKRLKGFEERQIVESEKDEVWRNETLRMLQHQSIDECTASFSGIRGSLAMSLRQWPPIRAIRRLARITVRNGYSIRMWNPNTRCMGI